MSVTHSWFGTSPVKLRCTRSSKVAALTRFFRRLRVGIPASFSWAMILSTSFLETETLSPRCNSGPNPPVSVSAVGGAVRLGDHVSLPEPLHVSRGASPAPPTEVPGSSRAQNPAAEPHSPPPSRTSPAPMFPAADPHSRRKSPIMSPVVASTAGCGEFARREWSRWRGRHGLQVPPRRRLRHRVGPGPPLLPGQRGGGGRQGGAVPPCGDRQASAPPRPGGGPWHGA